MEEGGQDLVVSPVINRAQQARKWKKVYENFEHKPNAVHAGKMAFDRDFDKYGNRSLIGRIFQKSINSLTVSE